MKTVNRIQVAAALRKHGIIPAIEVWLSNRFRVITRASFLGKLGPAMSRDLRALGLANNPAREGWKCTHQVLYGLARAKILNARSGGVDLDITVGLIGFDDLLDGAPGHAVVLGLYGADLSPVCWDFNSHAQYRLTPEEGRNCMYSIF